nr:MAG TPA_asm: hypothetical protein [Bacteriophage sp.]DAR92592.1 MAG TPA: hypothetical protein [Bacteriophage sp.]DAT49425.1 MAG TPA: hypothetical protein [Bacteriophage sp.]
MRTLQNHKIQNRRMPTGIEREKYGTEQRNSNTE